MAKKIPPELKKIINDVSKKIRKHELYPSDFSSKKENYEKMYKLFEDGTIEERVRLYIENDRDREAVIAWHFLLFENKFFRKEKVGIELVSRDDPWDFEIKLSNGEHFFIEITSIADDDEQFIRQSREKHYRSLNNKEYITKKEFKQLIRFFPNLKGNKEISPPSENELIVNPIFNDFKQFIGFNSEVVENLGDKLIRVIGKKVEKSHNRKQETVLIIDNRSGAYGLKDLEDAIKNNQKYFDSLTFKEVWFYTGYYSDFMFEDYEAGLTPLKKGSKIC